ncbi:hypothetical protein [Eikenella corrodens]|uniref:Uncharacterized protein n=1 Tax=Eikenella corrodens TaxID=539 RepID=A0A3S9SGJ2_EIKCO|nr:hypothetical protein [Eikenella corrodens]AZR58607.1 hypothetical protein ELB75_00230 [Eikenella corrodens]
MKAHKHAALMLQYAQDAAETDSPWERWEFEVKSGVWCNLSEHPAWLENKNYRRKPQVIRVGRHEFPKPISEALEIGMKYWFITFSEDLGEFAPFRVPWNGDKVDKAYLDSRVIHLTESAAQAHADVLNAICQGDVE